MPPTAPRLPLERQRDVAGAGPSNVSFSGLSQAACPDRGKNEPSAIRRGRPHRRRDHRPADLHHANLRGWELGAFRLARRQPGDARVRCFQRRHLPRQRLVRETLAPGGRNFRRPVRTAAGRLQPAGAANSLQRHFPRLRSRAEMAPPRQLSPLLPAILRRRAVSRDDLSHQAEDIRARLFRGHGRLRPLGTCRARGNVSSAAGKSSYRPPGALDDRGIPMVRRHKRPALRRRATHSSRRR